MFFPQLVRTNVADLLLVQMTQRILTNTKKRDHITPVLISLHWLPVKYRIQHKVLMCVYKALHNQAPEYIKDMLTPYQSQRHLRSSQNMLLPVPRSRLRRSGDRAFSVAAPALWNVLPLISIKVSSSMDIFKKDLKTYLFIKLLVFNWVGVLWRMCSYCYFMLYVF